jgi:photosystem II stability/assembly factor-like uncharacterized protein
MLHMYKPLAYSILALCSIAFAETYDPALFSSLKWRSIGPNRGGRSITSAGSPSRPLEYYFGAVGGGLWKTVDAGTTWKPVTDGQLKSSSVGAVAVSESNPDVVYIGMGETELRGNIMQGDGVYKSVDAGKTWKNVGLNDSQAIARVRVHPTNPDIVFVAAFGHPYGPNAERGVFRTKDGGKTWQKVLYRSDHSGAVDLCFDPHNPNVLFAAIWDAYRTPWSLSSGGPESGLFKTTDGGDHWTEITRNSGLPQGIVGKIGVAVSGADSKRIYAMVEADDGGVFTSDDSGATWKKVSEDRRVRQRAFYYTRIYADPKDRETIYILNTSFFRSIDGGKTYKVVRTPHGDNHDLWIAPNDNKRMVNSNDGGANVSFTGGETWTGQAFPTAQLYHIAVTKDVPYHVCGAQQDNTTICVSSEETGGRGGRVSPVMYQVAGGESGYIAPDPKNANVFYAGSQGALLTRFDRTTNQARDIQVYPLFFSGMPARDLKERWQWTFPIVFSPKDSNVLYTCSQHLWKTVNEGQTWQTISPDLTRGDPKTLGDSGGPITKDQNGPEIYGTIFAIAPAPQDVNLIWTGSDDGLAHVTRDGGQHWENITPKDFPEFMRISIIDASPHTPGTAYLAGKRYQLDDTKPYIYKIENYGKKWTKIVTGIPANDFVHSVREDPKRPGLLYAGTEHGIYVSFDDGAHWQSLLLNLPDTQVSDLLIAGDDLAIATHGRSFYILDDITWLRQLKPDLLGESAHLFRPRPAVRSVGPAALNYYLKQPADKLTLQILDSSGQVVRTFESSPEEDKKGKKETDEDSDFGPPAPKPPSRTAGLNRFAWDLRYPGATVFEGLIMWGARAEQGPATPPGEFQARIIANGVTQTEKFTVLKDPRLGNVTNADLEAQFKLAVQVRDKVSQADDMVVRIRALKKSLKERADKAKDPEFSANAERLETRLSAIEEDIYQVRNRSNQDPLNFPIKLNNQIAALARSIETGDARPTDASYVVFQELTARLEALKAKLDELEKHAP